MFQCACVHNNWTDGAPYIIPQVRKTFEIDLEFIVHQGYVLSVIQRVKNKWGLVRYTLNKSIL